MTPSRDGRNSALSRSKAGVCSPSHLSPNPSLNFLLKQSPTPPRLSQLLQNAWRNLGAKEGNQSGQQRKRLVRV
jgi:hypothetical protein